ncbi:cassette chromosome recombinase b [Schistosoma japonicum]|nr:cassette chromosome recombinase b [Schistosoma japonicum]KAH8861502.1 cassette chromosome recombinase b [Schistosoma japonicum]KAH8861503.1 cassette chromosome recombinase b [Schistosoma japonicum]KAH8861504.1 cassette chromosome recombinase b [Schistosoma japonicum]
MFDDTLTDVVLADFHILESPCINTLYDHGPQFHLNLQCPTCETFKEAFVCCDCIKNDSIFSWKSGKISFPQNSDRIVTVRRLVNDLNRKIKTYEPILFKSVFHTSSRIEELKSLISSLGNTIRFFTNTDLEKRKRLHRIRQAMTRCHTSSQQLLKQQASLVRHFITVAQRKKLLVADLDIVNRQIKQMLDTYFEELLGVYFVTDLSVSLLVVLMDNKSLANEYRSSLYLYIILFTRSGSSLNNPHKIACSVVMPFVLHLPSLRV